MVHKYKWFVVYKDNTRIDEDDKSFDEINKKNIDTFGMTGNGITILYDSNYVFHIGSHIVEFNLIDDNDDNKDITLTDAEVAPIQFKEAHTDFAFKRYNNKIVADPNRDISVVDKYCIGYKAKHTDLIFQPILIIDQEKCEIYFEVKISGQYSGYIDCVINNSIHKLSNYIELNNNACIFKLDIFKHE